MNASHLTRWSTSFADLALLLLGFFVLLHVAEGKERAVLASTRAALGGPVQADDLLYSTVAAPMFADGEARLRADSRARMVALGRRASARGYRVQIESSAGAKGAARFDRWELAAARAAAVARAIREGGMVEDRIEIMIPKTAAADKIHRLTVRRL